MAAHVCAHVHVHTHIHIHVYACVHVGTHEPITRISLLTTTCTHTSMLQFSRTQLHCIYEHVLIHIHIHVHVHGAMHMYMYIYVAVPRQDCMSACGANAVLSGANAVLSGHCNRFVGYL